MTLTSLIWKIERFLIRAKCTKCKNYMFLCIRCRIFNKYVNRDSNCMYYKKSGWF